MIFLVGTEEIPYFSSKSFNVSSLLWWIYCSSRWTWLVPLTHQWKGCGDPAAVGQGPFVRRVVEKSDTLPRPAFFLGSKCWFLVLRLWRSFRLLQYCCFEQFCFSSLSFREITSSGILTTNGGWEILFLIRIFTPQIHLFPVIPHMQAKNTHSGNCIIISGNNIFLWEVTFVQNAKKKKKP